MWWEKVKSAYSHGLLFYEIQKKTGRLGIDLQLFYLVSEGDFTCEPEWQESFGDYQSCVLSRDEMELIAPEHPWDDIVGLKNRWDSGHLCIGLKHSEKIVAFTWADLKECNHAPLRFDIAENEAYLYDAFTMKQFRGKGLAPFMRYMSYEYLRSVGREHFYSISAYYNKPSIVFKQKLNASFDQLFFSISTKSGTPRTLQLRDHRQVKRQIKR